MRSVLAATATLLCLAACSSAPTRTPAGGSAASPPARSSTSPGAAPAATTTDWPTYHGNAARSGYAPSMPTATTLRLVTRKALDGAVYASPIVAKGTIVVATENDTVYAYDSGLHLLWRHHLGAPAPRSQLPCGNIDPLGITGTPVYDAADGYVFVAAEFGSPPRHTLFALRLSNGTVAWRRSLDLPGVTTSAMQQRGALTVTGGRVWVPFGGLAGDCSDYKGRVIGYRVDGSGYVQYTVPTAREAGIWTPPGPSVDSSGYLYVAVGNGAATSPTDPYDHSDSVLKLAPATAHVVQFFAPRSWASDNASDLDLGSQGPALVGQWVFAAGKSGTAYVLQRSALGGIGGQVSSAPVCASFGGTAVVGSTVYVPCQDGVRAVRIDSTGRMHVLWHAASGTAGSPVVGGGRVFALDQGAGVLHALDPATGASRAAVAVGPVSRFATPAVTGGRLLVPTMSGFAVVSTT